MVRYEDDRAAIVVAGWGPLAPALPIGTRVPLGGGNVTSLVFRTGRAARLDDYETPQRADRRARGGRSVRAAVGAPIVVEGRLWGAMSRPPRRTRRCPRTPSRASASSPS